MKIIVDKTGTTLINNDGSKLFNANRKLEYTIDDNDIVWFNAPTSMSKEEFYQKDGEDIVLTFECKD